eukprot:CAMPEP_0179315134 /NCGR_PEP_ID=MMETSP0797-20121207/54885_1 /TAXON_ID=47934 /ORGANISM="Dinophysis acuminata, Strain DAEP01" /LENGTH=37 /DNA_ID= /DNA_START= /DNA_END= /DNA_ORIENTATION=
MGTFVRVLMDHPTLLDLNVLGGAQSVGGSGTTRRPRR